MNENQCKQFNALLVDALYDELKERDKGFFRAHLETCSSCSAEYNRMVSVLEVMDQRRQPEMDETFWDNFLPQLHEKIGVRETGPAGRAVGWLQEWWGNLNFKLNIRWALYPAAVVLLIVSGIVIGRYLYSPGGEEFIGPTVASVNPGVSEHFDNVRPLLIDYSNYSKQEDTGGKGDMVRVDRETLRRLVVQNHLLKKAVERENNASLIQLLEDLEMILLEISNAGPNGGRSDSIQAVQDIMED
ncbi:MAG: zf-HC2 domain-containing protein, partial [bacterium]|nr:zf-HC2 domain-containing protein [bacterium]